MAHRTPLYNEHLAAAAKLVDFAGWDMPIHYGSQLEEHHQVRRDAGMFDVSHMAIVDLRGAEVRAFLKYLIANNVDKLKPQQALYTCMLNEAGGVIDDLIVYFMSEDWFRIVVNAATRDKDLAWIKKQAAPFKVTVTERLELAMIAVQGPRARGRVAELLDDTLRAAALELKPFYATYNGELFIGRTGYTGEDGFELMLPGGKVPQWWRKLLERGVRPAGLGARDTLRLEAGMNLYSLDMDESITPLECGLEWTVAWQPVTRDFIGRAALERQKSAGVTRKLVGLVLNDKGVLRNHLKVRVSGIGEGEITSGGYSPTLGKAIALARVPAATGTSCEVEIRGKWVPATVVKPPFVRHGRAVVVPAASAAPWKAGLE